jgi:hypothetical protein
MPRDYSERSFAAGLGSGLAISALAALGFHLLRRASPPARAALGLGTLSAAWYLLWREGAMGACPPGELQPPITQSTITTAPADMDLGAPGHNLEARLDEGIHETFPASDPVSIHIE